MLDKVSYNFRINNMVEKTDKHAKKYIFSGIVDIIAIFITVPFFLYIFVFSFDSPVNLLSSITILCSSYLALFTLALVAGILKIRRKYQGVLLAFIPWTIFSLLIPLMPLVFFPVILIIINFIIYQHIKQKPHKRIRLLVNMYLIIIAVAIVAGILSQVFGVIRSNQSTHSFNEYGKKYNNYLGTIKSRIQKGNYVNTSASYNYNGLEIDITTFQNPPTPSDTHTILNVNVTFKNTLTKTVMLPFFQYNAARYFFTSNGKDYSEILDMVDSFERYYQYSLAPGQQITITPVFSIDQKYLHYPAFLYLFLHNNSLGATGPLFRLY